MGQPVAPKASLTNVRVDLDVNRVRVMYDIEGITARDSVYIQAESRSRGLLNAATVTGDVGTAILPGKNKTIYWDYRLDEVKIDDDIRVTVYMKSPVEATGGGPANALLSVVAPGIGSIFVQPDRKIGLRPLITGAYVGLLVYGLVRRSQSKHQYGLYADQLIMADYQEANRLHHHYLVATWTAVGLLLTDVTYTLLKGLKNDKQRRASQQRVAIGYIGTAPTIGVQFHF
jgi:hypothetical protein